MSRSQPETTTQNPAKYVLEWAGASDGGYFRYFDKERKDEECEGKVKIDDIEFAYLDERSAVLGWSQSNQASIYSNEVKFMNEPVVVLTFSNGKSKKLLEGVYKDIKTQANEMGAKYHKIVYAMVTKCSDPKIPEGTVVRFKLKGAAVKSWGDLQSKTAGAISVSFEEAKNGAVKYRFPVFAPCPISSELEELAYKKDQELQCFFEARAAQHEKKEEEQEAQTVPADDDEDQVPF